MKTVVKTVQNNAKKLSDLRRGQLFVYEGNLYTRLEAGATSNDPIEVMVHENTLTHRSYIRLSGGLVVVVPHTITVEI